jgi:1,4-dihydroxy-2-naphthoate octaprenyltransferase
MGTTYLHTGSFDLPALLAALPVGALVTAILVVNNLRDIDTDRKAGKHTLAVIVGRTATRGWYCFLIAVAYLLLPAYILAGFFSIWALLAWLTLPLAVRLVRIVTNQQGRPLNRALAGTGQLHMLFGVLLTIGMLIPAIIRG